jgi:hypothetical protein
MGLEPDPLRAFADSGYQERINEQRADGHAMGWT